MRTIVVLASGPVGARFAEMAKVAMPDLRINVIWDASCDTAPPKTDFVEIFPGELRASKLGSFDVGVLAWWPNIVSEEILQCSAKGFINIHPSLLPFGRGKDPNFWAIIEGTPFGVTCHVVSSSIDKGPRISWQEIPVQWESTGGTLYQAAVELAPSVLLTGLERFLNDVHPENLGYEMVRGPKRRSEIDPASRISLSSHYTGRELLNMLRARTFQGMPACKFEDELGNQFEVRVEIRPLEQNNKNVRE